MKTTAFLSQRALITGIVVNIFISLLFISDKAFSQNNVSNSTTTINDTCNLVSFIGKRVEQKNYLNCTIRSAIKGYFLVLEKSDDGVNFLPLEIKKGQVSPGNQLLQFSFIDNSATSLTTYKICAYKVSITKKGGQKFSEVSENLLNGFKNSTININVLENESLQEYTASWK